MAKKPAAAATAESPMDYAQHNATYTSFMAMVKAGIASCVFLVLALYCFIVAAQPWLGLVLILAMPVAGVLAFSSGKKQSS
jgi:hypothetical protein